MEAPKKLYFTQTENGTHYYTEGIPFERKYVEYTRTDAFIEKACDWLKNNLPSAMVRSDFYMFNGEFIEDFKKAMEGGEE